MASASWLSTQRNSIIIYEVYSANDNKRFRNNHKEVMEKFKVKASDRKYQIWERNALIISLRNQSGFKQKLDYIHANPLVAGLCRFPEEYKYSSAAFMKKEQANGIL